MPVAMQSHDDFHDRNPAPLQTINRGPDFIRERLVANSKVSRKPEFGGQSAHWKKGVNDNIDVNDNFMKMRSRGRHKERDGGTDAGRLYSNKNEMNLVDASVQMVQRNSGGGEVDSSEVKLSVKERVQLFNTQNGDPPKVPRGRHRGPRGWFKKRDQSAPPSNSRNRVFQTEQPSGEKGSSARRSRSIERSSDQKSIDEPLDNRLDESEFVAKQQRQSGLSYSNNFRDQYEVNQIERFESNNTHVNDNSLGHNATSTSTLMGEPHFNPRSRMRDARTVKKFSKSVAVKRNSPPGSHIQNVLNSLRQKEVAVESTSESSVNVSERERGDGRSGVSVKRMVSFIHKGGLEDTNASRPSNVCRQKNTGQDSDQFSVFSSSQTDSFIPAKKTFKCSITSSKTASLDTESNRSGPKVKRNHSSSLNKETDIFKEEVLEKVYVPKLENKVVTSLKGESLSFENDDQVDSRTKLSLSADDVEGSVQTIESENTRSLKVTSGLEKMNQNMGTISTNISSGSHGMQVYNINYRSDSSSSRSKTDAIETKDDGVDHEWNEIVAKSYALSSTSEIEPGATGNCKGAKSTSKSKPPLKKVSSQSTYKESDNDDVFDGSMHPLDFALAVHSIKEYTLPPSPDRSHGSKSTPRDGVVFARRVQVTDETDGNSGIEDDTRIESGLEKQLVANKSGNWTKSEPIYAEVKKEKKPSELSVPGKVTPLAKSSSGESKSSRKKESYSSLTTVNLKADMSQSTCKVTDVSSSHDVSVEVDVDSEEDYVKINPLYNLPPNTKNADVLILKGDDEGKIKCRQEEPVMSKILPEETQENPPSSPPEVQKPKVSAASPEVRRHRAKGKHYKMPSKSSVTSTGSVSYHHSSHSSTSNDAGNRRRSRNKKTSVLSHALFVKPKDLPPNDITVIDPHSSVDSTMTPRPRSRSHSRSKSHRSNSDVSSASASSLSQLNKFFDMMGLESDVLSSVLQPVSYEDDSVFQDMHTWRVGSSTNSSHSGGLSEGSRVSEDGVMNMKRLTKLPDQSQSIITKNARVIKWLVQCKKSHTVVR